MTPIDDSNTESRIEIRTMAFKLADYEYEIVFKSRNINKNAGALSRNPISRLVSIIFLLVFTSPR